MKIYLDTVGCRLNQSEIETYARQFSAGGHTLVSSMEEANMMVLNTCAVTAPAAADSRQKIRRAQRSGVREIVVTGCWATLEPEKAAALPGVTRVVPNEKKDFLVPDLLQIEIDAFDLEPVERVPIPGERMRTRAFIKVQDGCDNRCTFCVTTVARGEGRSRPAAEVVSDVRAALKSSVKEVVLTGVHLGSWGQDFKETAHLKNLVQKILHLTDPPRLRLSSLEPWDLDEDFFALWDDPRLCRHLHLPLQSGSAATLRRMARKTTPGSFAELVEAARRQIPDVAITTDVIVGFPGETEAEFAETRAFVEEIAFADAHVFTYSARPGTAAASMPRQVHNYTRKERNAEIQAVVAESSASYRRQFIGQKRDVLWESSNPSGQGDWTLSGLTDNYLPVSAVSSLPLWNQLTPTHLKTMGENRLQGEIISDPDTILLEI